MRLSVASFARGSVVLVVLPALVCVPQNSESVNEGIGIPQRLVIGTICWFALFGVLIGVMLPLPEFTPDGEAIAYERTLQLRALIATSIAAVSSLCVGGIVVANADTASWAETENVH